MNLNALRNMGYGVYVIGAWDEGRPVGCVANSAMQITSSPATVALSLNHNNYTNSCVAKGGFFSIAMLAEDSDSSIIGRFGFSSSRDTDKYEGLAYSVRGNLPVIDDACGFLVCKVIDRMETATHTVFLGEVVEADTLREGTAMSYAYYHNVIKGKSPKNAPTYIPEKTEGKDRWVCSVCGYEYNGETPFEELPEDYQCPVCGKPKSAFEKK